MPPEADSTPELGVPTNRLISGQQLLVSCYPLGNAPTPCPSDLLFRRDALEKVRAFEDWPHTFYEDQAFLAKVYLENTVYVADACWDRYRLHPDSCSAVVFKSGRTTNSGSSTSNGSKTNFGGKTSGTRKSGGCCARRSGRTGIRLCGGSRVLRRR